MRMLDVSTPKAPLPVFVRKDTDGMGKYVKVRLDYRYRSKIGWKVLQM